ncbi:hypothetical protein OQA88_11573 [Cercophora sp. LCS_1]
MDDMSQEPPRPPAHENSWTPAPNPDPAEDRKLILFFDGTGNTFSGSNADTNVVKLLNKLDRNSPTQFHYYQTGIGTYDVNATSVDQTWMERIKSSIGQTMDQGFGAGFDAHVLAGYRFLMRYYSSGDKIYMFGFSRGAFTAKFLARMIHTVGLLCKGNEEMVPFAYRLYQRYLSGEIQQFSRRHHRASTTSDADSQQHAKDEIAAFSNTFCRKEAICHHGRLEERNIKVFFLGMWDCVNSVAVLESKTPKPIQIKGTAKYVRHAVAVDERRVKFKAALLAQDIRDSADDEDIREVWFPGCHGDVGGGWPASETNKLDAKKEMSFWERIKNTWTTRTADKATKYIDSGPFQMSDIPLAWMIREVELVGKEEPTAAVNWRRDSIERFKTRFKKKKRQAEQARYHDSLSFGYGTGFFTVLLWRVMGELDPTPRQGWEGKTDKAEWFPFITRWELEGDDWVNVRFPLNRGATRDIPPDAVLHESLISRLRDETLSYRPTNNHGGKSAPCLKHNGRVADFKFACEEPEADYDHRTYKFDKPGNVG